jgi:hypothetical protein
MTVTFPQLTVVLVLSSTAFIAVEIEKAVRRRRPRADVG